MTNTANTTDARNFKGLSSFFSQVIFSFNTIEEEEAYREEMEAEGLKVKFTNIED